MAIGINFINFSVRLFAYVLKLGQERCFSIGGVRWVRNGYIAVILEKA